MGSLLKPWIVRYQDAEGRFVAKGTPGATKVKDRAEKWYGQYKDANGKRQRVPLCTDKQAAKKLLAKLEADAKTKELYPEPPISEQERKAREHSGRTILEHLEDFRRHLESNDRVSEYVQHTYSCAHAIIERCRFQHIADLQPSAIDAFLGQLRKPTPLVSLPSGKELFTVHEVTALLGMKPEAIGRMARRRLLACKESGRERRFHRADVEAICARRCRGLGIATSNHYLTAIKRFSKWLVKDGRATHDPLAYMSRLNARTDIRRRRRSLDAEAFARLLEGAMQGRPFRGLTGEDRAILYLFASNTGLRANELASLTPNSFNLDAKNPAVTVAAAYSKHRREDVQTLRGDLARVMRSYFVGKPADQQLWPGSWSANAAEMLRIDLAAAGIPYEDNAGQVFDFHSTRHKFISDLAASGVHPKVAQVLARHSTIQLTMDHYTHLSAHDQTAALAKLPALTLPKKHENDPRQTGAA